MKKITLKNGTGWEFCTALETEEFHTGACRRTLTVTAEPDAIGLQELYSELTQENLATITMLNDEEESPIANIYDGYVLPLALGVKKVLLCAETPDTPALYGSVLELKLGRRTYLEQQLQQLGVSVS